MRLYILIGLIISNGLSAASSGFQDTAIPSMIVDTSPYSFLKFNYCDKTLNVTVQKTSSEVLCRCAVSQVTPTIRDDYTHTQGIGAHKLHKKATTWNKARKICSEEGGHLAIINSKAEETVLIKMLFEAKNSIIGALNTDEAFVGLHDLYEEGEWVTLDGESLHLTGFSTWTTKYGFNPDNSGGHQNCGAVVVDGGLDDVFCDANYAFFCEIPRIC